MNQCPCGSGKPYEVCCGPLHAGAEKAQTAEALMRSRFSAYVKRQYPYLGESLHPDHRHDYDPIATQRWADESDWLSLEIVNVANGGEQDDEGQVEFIATYREKGVIHPHHEQGNFRRHEGVWYYVDGKLVPQATQRLEAPKVGRNDPCPCGSGKKYKKCCGR
jgi:SEC-C motif-containing protein